MPALEGYADGIAKLQRDTAQPASEQARAVVDYICARLSNRVRVYLHAKERRQLN